eukprot:4103441-Pleurochrysis_carterae.AAC.4
MNPNARPFTFNAGAAYAERIQRFEVLRIGLLDCSCSATANRRQHVFLAGLFPYRSSIVLVPLYHLALHPSPPPRVYLSLASQVCGLHQADWCTLAASFVPGGPAPGEGPPPGYGYGAPMGYPGAGYAPRPGQPMAGYPQQGFPHGHPQQFYGQPGAAPYGYGPQGVAPGGMPQGVPSGVPPGAPPGGMYNAQQGGYGMPPRGPPSCQGGYAPGQPGFQGGPQGQGQAGGRGGQEQGQGGGRGGKGRNAQQGQQGQPQVRGALALALFRSPLAVFCSDALAVSP